MTSAGRQQVTGGFTLVELLLATAIFAMLAAALYSVFHGALRLRENAEVVLAKDRPQRYVAAILARDFRNMLPPAGVLAGDMLGENYEEGGASLDSIEFFTSTGVVADSAPWGDMQQVSYYLEEPEEEEDAGTGAYDLIRVARRNLLPSSEDEEEDNQERLLHHVASLDLTYFDGEAWQESWDSSAQDNALPEAIGLRLDFVDPAQGARRSSPIELLCETVATPLDAEADDSGGRAQ
jgi:general secretion pathway protein J